MHAACRALVQRFLDLVADDAGSPLRGCAIDDVAVAGGRIHRSDDPGAGEALHGHPGPARARRADRGRREQPPRPRAEPAWRRRARSRPSSSRSASTPTSALLRVARVVSVVDGGRILNEKLARSQIIGGTVGGIGQALFEETVTDPGTGRIANATFADYLVPVNADVPDMDVVFVGEPDPLTPIGTKGVGEIGLVGVAAAIANAVYHATGRRIRSLPITLDQLL